MDSQLKRFAAVALWMTAAAARAGTPGPVPLPPPPDGTNVAAPAAASAPANLVLRLSPILLLGWTSESQVDLATPVAGAGVEAVCRLSRAHALTLGLAEAGYRRTVLTGPLDPATGQPARVDVDEQRWSADLTYGLDVLRLFSVPRASGELVAGGAWRGFRNEIAATNLLGPVAGARAALALSEALGVSGRVMYGRALGSPDAGPLLLGGPRTLVSYAAAVEVRAGGGLAVALGYAGERVVNERSVRTWNGLSLQLDIGF